MPSFDQEGSFLITMNRDFSSSSYDLPMYFIYFPIIVSHCSRYYNNHLGLATMSLCFSYEDFLGHGKLYVSAINPTHLILILRLKQEP
jgi:hypothetical protein